jgi:hypothetical protein
VGTPFVLLDGAEENLRANRGEETPELSKKLSLAARGTLLIENAAAISDGAARLIAERARSGEFSCIISAADLSQVKAPLAWTASDATITLPTLAERGEDLMAIIISELTRLGLATRGSPFGLARPVMTELLDREYPGNEEELKSLLFRGACRATSDLISYEDIFGDGKPEVDDPTPPPPRARARVAPRSYRRS